VLFEKAKAQLVINWKCKHGPLRRAAITRGAG
jgi:hypothetical protein